MGVNQEILERAAKVVEGVISDYLPKHLKIAEVVATSRWLPDQDDYVDVKVLIKNFDHNEVYIPLYVRSFRAIQIAVSQAGINPRNQVMVSLGDYDEYYAKAWGI